MQEAACFLDGLVGGPNDKKAPAENVAMPAKKPPLDEK